MGLLDESEARQYLHVRRGDFDLRSTRLDFTETVAFVAATKLVKDGDSLVLQIPEFHLAEQMTQYAININLHSSHGRYGFGRKLITSTVPVYS